ncbi:succinyl transferase OpgC [Candidatus Falkowbacteria bacterium]|nr:succinyl transferase OpgC [Candidatus Falkowbacteria bacterium]
MEKQQLEPKKREKNLYISYIKGVAIIGIILIHLIDWSNMVLTSTGDTFKDLLQIAVFLFVFTSGSVVYFAYGHRSFAEQTKRLLYRGFQIIFLYYLYSIIKLLVFDFSTEPLYYQFTNKNALTIIDILLFRSFSVPIAILITFAFLLFVSPLILLVQKKSRYPKVAIGFMIAVVFIINYFTNAQSTTGPVIDLLYARGNVLFPTMLWLTPFLIGFFLALAGFEKQKGKIFLVSGALAIISAALLAKGGKSLKLSDNEFPLAPYFIFCSTFGLSLLLYFFSFLEKLKNRIVISFMAILRLLGDDTLYLYLYQWVIIDCTIWIFPKRPTLIWLTVPAFFVCYLLIKRKKLLEYYYMQLKTA